ncbi:hypothetical protein [Methanoculleus sp.]|uniref:hypothetical protein n=1 Tax=Methanoculleus sp. TaxID=90427 RepID=UPI0025F61A2B|nr:hypothetical protein [Methanoculleus sp.]
MPDTIGMVGLFVAIGGQYLVLFQLYRMMNRLDIELATCPYHRSGQRPPGVVSDE